MAPVAKEFDKIIQDGRERKKNEALASKIFSKNRRQSAPSKLKPGAGASLASRVGIRKIPQRAITVGRRASVPAGDVNGEWTHDLHHTVSKKPGRVSIGGGLSARITQPGAAPAAAGGKIAGAAGGGGGGLSKSAAKRRAKLAAAVGDAMDMDSDQVNMVATSNSSSAAPKGLTIRGLAGPFAVLGQNFAPGTTPADVESAMTPVGGEMVSCRVVKSQPLLIMEMVFASREGGERVIETFNNKTADGRIIKIYPKIGGYQPTQTPNNNNAQGAPANAPTGPRSSRNQVVDGSMGFGIDVTRGGKAGNGGGAGAGGGALFSDKMISSSSSGRRGGRGGSRGRGR
ncbi:hypothetical protein K4F52_003046 [Lecanicillium sp. MT-2017a]|nr:hypothetical protein K4F52_003046 [Lecanicillium sp. MT-2017a]